MKRLVGFLCLLASDACLQFSYFVSDGLDFLIVCFLLLKQNLFMFLLRGFQINDPRLQVFNDKILLLNPHSLALDVLVAYFFQHLRSYTAVC